MLLAGCATARTMETVADEWAVPVMAQPRQIEVKLPGEASVGTMESDAGRLYMGDGYEIAVQTMAAGDLDATVRSISGFSRDDLTLMQTQAGDCKRYEFVWAAAGEQGQRTGHAVILDDGDYHYCLSVLRDAEGAEESQIIWSEVFHSFSLC